MKKIVQDNFYFFICCFLFFLFGGILLAFIDKPDVIFFFSDHRTPFSDTFFTYFTKMGEEPMYLVMLFTLIMVKIRYAILIPLIGFCVSGLSFLTKGFFAHDRPLIFLENNGLDVNMNFIEGIQLYTGQTSFPSGHTMSAFALYGLVAFLFPKKKLMGIVFFTIALLTGISRIYLVQHFFQDVYLGALMGVALAMLFYWAQKRVKVEDNHWSNFSLWKRNKERKLAAHQSK